MTTEHMLLIGVASALPLVGMLAFYAREWWEYAYPKGL